MGKRTLKNTARAGAARAVAGDVATRAKQTARDSAAAAAGVAASTGRVGARVARSSVSAAAKLGASTGRAGANIAKRMGRELASTMRTAASSDDAVWAGGDSDAEPGTATASAPQTRNDALAALQAAAERVDQAQAAAARAAFDAGATVTEIARTAGKSRRTIKDWLADT